MLRLRASLLATCLLVSSSALAGTSVPPFRWAVQPQAVTGQSSGHGVAMDFSGNTFVCGTFTDTLSFTTGTLQATGGNAPGNTDAYLVKYGTDGTALWARNGGNSTQNTNEVGYAVALDASGNSYMTGEYSGASATSFGGIQIDDTGGGAFLVKYDAGGTVQWAKSLTETGVGNSVALSGTSLIYVFVGGFPSSAVYKVNTSDGSVADTWTFNAFFPDQIPKVSVDGSGNVIISGSFMGTVDFDPGVSASNLVADGFNDGFVAKYTSAGGLLWAKKLTSSGADAVKNHALTSSGEIYFSGSLEANGSIDVATANGGEVVGRLDAAGNGVWMRNTVGDFQGTPTDVYADGVGVDGDGNYYIYGVGLPGNGTIGAFTVPLTNHFYVVKYSSAGAVTYAKFVTSPQFIQPRAILVAGIDLYNVVGGMVDQSVFDSFTLPDINGFPRQASFSAQVGDVTPVLASLATAEASPDRVRITWYVTGLDGAASVERQRGDQGWEILGDVTRNGADYVSYEDRDVSPGDRMMYRLMWRENGVVLRSEPVTVVVPRRIEALSLAVGPNPANASVDALISVPAAGEAALAMHDLQGRQVMDRHVEVAAAGRMTVRLGTSGLPAGLYWLTLRHGGETARARVSVVR